MPTTISSSASNQTLAIYGSGLNSSIRVSVDGYYNYSGTILYDSVDGTVAVFSLPSGVPVGMHNIVVSNDYGSVASEPINVTQ